MLYCKIAGTGGHAWCTVLYHVTVQALEEMLYHGASARPPAIPEGVEDGGDYAGRGQDSILETGALEVTLLWHAPALPLHVDDHSIWVPVWRDPARQAACQGSRVHGSMFGGWGGCRVVQGRPVQQHLKLAARPCTTGSAHMLQRVMGPGQQCADVPPGGGLRLTCISTPVLHQPMAGRHLAAGLMGAACRLLRTVGGFQSRAP